MYKTTCYHLQNTEQYVTYALSSAFHLLCGFIGLTAINTFV